MVDSENSDDLLYLCGKLPHILPAGSTYMTDEGPAFPIIAATLQLKHLLCANHLSTRIFEKCGGLGASADAFKKDISTAIFEDLGERKNLDCHLGVMLMEYSTQAAKDFIKHIIAVKEQACFTYTKEYFTAGNVATQRSEGMNGNIKEQGQYKKELQKMNNHRLAIHLLDMEERRYNDVIDELKKAHMQGQCLRNWSTNDRCR